MPQTSVTIRLSDYPSPERVGFANRFSLVDRGLVAEIVYWLDWAPGPAKVVARIGVYVDDLAGPIWEHAQGFMSESRAWLDKAEIPVSEPSPAPESQEGEVRIASMVGLSRSGLDALMNWYYITPDDFIKAKATGKGKPRVEPVVGVSLPIDSVLGLLAAVGRIQPEISARLGSAGKVGKPAE